MGRIAGLLLGGIMAVLCLASAVPATVMLAGTFWKDGHLSMAHFAAAFSDRGRLLALLSNSAIVTAGAVATSLALGAPMGFLCFRTDLPLRRWIVRACLVAACIPLYVTATGWMALLGMQFWLYRPWGAAWITGIACAPLAALITGVCFAMADRDLEDATHLDAGRARAFWKATVPMAAWGIGAAGLAVALLSVWDITVTDILMVRTFAEEIFTQFQLGAGPWTAIAVSLPPIGILLSAGALLWRAGRAHGEAPAGEAGPAAPSIRLGRWRPLLLGLVLLVCAAFFALPLGALIRAVGRPANLATAVCAAGQELMGTLTLTPLAATVCTILAAATGSAILRARRWRWAAGLWLVLLIAVPAPVVGIGLIRLLNRPGLAGAIYDSQAALVAAYVIRALPFAVLALLPVLRRIPRELDEALGLDGGGWIRRLTCIVFPLGWRGLAAAWCLAFALSLSEMGASFLVVPPGRTTLSIRFFTLIHYGVYPDAAGICLVLAALVAAAAGGLTVALGPMIRRWHP
jgi:iron(III) transport system permease protein